MYSVVKSRSALAAYASLVVSLSALAGVGGRAAGTGRRAAHPTASQPIDTTDLQIGDVTPRFLRFYDFATANHLDEGARWTLWQKEYGIAAVPPTEEGRALARARLDSVWSRYNSLVGRVPALTARAADIGRHTLPMVAQLLGASPDSVRVGLLLFVGEFSNNAYTVPPAGTRPATVVLPVEVPDQRLTLTHELTHAVHEVVARIRNGYGAPLGETVLMEGLAMRATQRLDPGHPQPDYTPATAYGRPWFAECSAHAAKILEGIRPYVSVANPATTERFTTGTGTTGLHDEAYCAGWTLVGKLLANGRTFAELARIPESEMPAFVSAEIARGVEN